MGVDGHKKEEEGDKAVGHYCSSMKEARRFFVIHADRQSLLLQASRLRDRALDC